MAKKVVEEGKIKIIPEFWKKVYYHWLDNVRDWCISRKIWWDIGYLFGIVRIAVI